MKLSMTQLAAFNWSCRHSISSIVKRLVSCHSITNLPLSILKLASAVFSDVYFLVAFACYYCGYYK
ncbi:hypothetical protein PUN28_000639 [Cardiocondyla obscurior]|uniref:Uncharacterized protein n=1 Tax=Cardiocondyla obscurior TaxID=286306 RepID=A0AAW2H0E2_9HYME